MTEYRERNFREDRRGVVNPLYLAELVGALGLLVLAGGASLRYVHQRFIRETDNILNRSYPGAGELPENQQNLAARDAELGKKLHEMERQFERDRWEMHDGWRKLEIEQLERKVDLMKQHEDERWKELRQTARSY